MGFASKRYQEACAKTAEHKEDRDCTVKMLMIAAGISYEAAHKLMEQEGRRNRKGGHGWQNSFEKLGFTLHLEPTVTAKTMRTLMPMLENDKTYVVQSAGHVSAIVNGDFADWADSRKIRVRRVYQVLPKNRARQAPPASILKARTKGWSIKRPQRGVGAEIWALCDARFDGSDAGWVSGHDKAEFIDDLQWEHRTWNRNNVATEVRCWFKFHIDTPVY